MFARNCSQGGRWNFAPPPPPSLIKSADALSRHSREVSAEPTYRKGQREKRERREREEREREAV